MNVTALDIAMRFIGTKEVPGTGDNPAIMAMLGLHNDWPENDETPWCSAFCAYPFWLLGVPGYSRSLLARSWLDCGIPVRWMGEARPGFDVVILKRGGGDQPGREDVTAPGHVGFFYEMRENAGLPVEGEVYLCSGNQGNEVSIKGFPASRILGVRRLGCG